MRNLRLIPRLDVKQNWLIKGVQMEGWRKVGDPAEVARRYAAQGADELVFMDVVASLYERNNLHEIVEQVASSVFIPLTVGGGIRTPEDVGQLLARGADKVALNTAATRDPKLITEISDQFGAQATVVSIEAIRNGAGRWQAMTDNGRNHTGRDAVEWAREVEACGAGELLVTSIDCDGLGKGYEIDLIRRITDVVAIPVVASGGVGSAAHLTDLIDRTEASAAAIAQALHWKKLTIGDLRAVLAGAGCFVRPLPEGVADGSVEARS
ncbi:imidazole glycerol phosphate synthase subunit HisF [Roseovarius sp. ZX-A-9]|uniref:imidazole glycerol phosphate synthase subunit HisF n=1 Tax=Roseovarius sp. ZX-A-9 TaxID=3014783 RepID=UPI00232DEFF9|nr:imidazole glycerol phosphate synthase cyclase subunit [Roseovarius sp. ZX-A-9]